MKLRNFVALTLLAAGLVSIIAAGENLNGIYLGEDVTAGDARIIAVQITEQGTVIAFKGMTVPAMHDRYGKPVVVKRVELR